MVPRPTPPRDHLRFTASSSMLNVDSVNVGSVVVGTAGNQTGTLTDNRASVSVFSVSLGGTNASEFSVSGLSFPVTLAPSQPGSFTVTFAPGAVLANDAVAEVAPRHPSTVLAVRRLVAPGSMRDGDRW